LNEKHQILCIQNSEFNIVAILIWCWKWPSSGVIV